MPKIEDGCYGSLKGIALIAKVLAGRCQMRYTRVAAGKGTMPEDLTPKTLTEPPEYVMDAMISSVTTPVDGECQVSIQINSANVESGFYCTWLILYAEDPDEGEVPFTALCLENEPEWIRPSSSIVGKLAHFDMIAAVGDVDNVSASIDLDALVTLESVQQLISEHGRDLETHQDLRQAVSNLEHKLGGGVIRAERLDITIPSEGWEDDEDTVGAYQLHADIINPKIAEDRMPILTVLPQSMGTAAVCGLCQTAKTLPGALRVYANKVPDSPIRASLILLGDLRKNGELTIPAVGWTEDAAGLYIDLPDEDITADLTPMLTILPESLQAAGECGVGTAAQTFDRFLRVYAKTTPSTAIRANLSLLGAAQSSGMKVRADSGLTLNSEGYLSLNSATGQEVAGLFNGSKANLVQE